LAFIQSIPQTVPLYALSLSDYQDTDEKRSVAAIFKICSYCGKVKEDVQDYDGGHSVQGFCADCAKELEISEMSS
jgi:hypothetical protein